MNELQIFNYQSNEIRVVVKDGQPWWVAKDICETLEIQNSRDAMQRLDEDEKGVVLTDTLGGAQELQAVNEPGLYTLVLGSRKPEAKTFKRWITHEVIPAIRKTGSYAMQSQTENPLILALIDFDNKIKTVETRQISIEEQLAELSQKINALNAPVALDTSEAPAKVFKARKETKLQRAREEKGLTLEAFAEKVGLSETFTRDIELGHGVPSMKSVLKIAEVLEITPAKVVKLLS